MTFLPLLVVVADILLVLCFSGCHLLFQHYLSECRLYLEAVPVLFRLELLENIFSLLFLSTAELAQQKDTNSNTCSAAQWEHLSTRHSEKRYKTSEVDKSVEGKQQLSSGSMRASPSGYLDLGHLVQGCRGFLLDVTAVEGFLKLLKDAVEGMCEVGQHGQDTGRGQVAERIGWSVRPDAYGTRLQRLSKHIAEAQWRLQIVTSNHSGGSGEKKTPNTVFGILVFNSTAENSPTLHVILISS